MPQTKTGVPQKTRVKSKEPWYLKAKREKERELEKKLGGIKTCLFCGGFIRSQVVGGTGPKSKANEWRHMFVESAAKFEPHYPEPALELGKENAD